MSAADPIDLRDPVAVADTLRAAAQACLDADCRDGAIDRIESPGTLIATGDLHDNPLNFHRLVRRAHLDHDQTNNGLRHLTLHECIHSDRLVHGMDFSYRALTRVAHLKQAHPEHVHCLLANHELSQIIGAGIIKDGVKVVEAFNEGVEYVFGDHTEDIIAAIEAFVRAMPLALRATTPRGDILCAHSLPGSAMMGRFDPSVLERTPTDDDYAPRRGSAHMLVWGRGHDDELLEDLTERWGVYLFVLGHEHAPHGVTFVAPNAVVLNTDTHTGRFLPIDLSNPPSPHEAAGVTEPIESIAFEGEIA